MAEVKQINITLPNGREIKGNVVTAFQSDAKNFLISHLDDPSIPQPEGMDNLSVSLLNGNSITGIEKSDSATWSPLTDYMRGIITGSSYPESYISDVPGALSATAELYARHIAVTSDQKIVLQNDYLTKTEVKEEAVAPVVEQPAPESTFEPQEMEPVVPAAEPVATMPEAEVEPPMAPVVEEPVVPTSVFDNTPVVPETPVQPEPAVMPTAEATPVAEPVMNTAEPSTNFDLSKMKEEFMVSVSNLFDQTFAGLSNMEAKMSQMEQELNAKLADANRMLAEAEEAKKDAEAKAAVATVAFNNAQSLNQTPVADPVGVTRPTPEGPALQKIPA